MKVASLDNVLFFLLIAVAALFQLLSRALKKDSKNDSDETPSESLRPQSPPRVRRAPMDSDAERIRKFLEALGQPSSSTPPRPVLPRSDIPPPPLGPVQPAPLIIPT